MIHVFKNFNKVIYGCILIVIILSCMSCASRNITDNQIHKVKYSKIHCGEWLQIELCDLSGNKVLFFQIFDQIDNTDVINSYKGLQNSFRGYPAKIEEDVFIWILVNARYEIRLLIDDGSNEYRNTEKLKQILSMFNYQEMDKYYKNKLNCDQFKKFIPEI